MQGSRYLMNIGREYIEALQGGLQYYIRSNRKSTQLIKRYLYIFIYIPFLPLILAVQSCCTKVDNNESDRDLAIKLVSK